MKALILSCATGGGHISAASAVKQAFELKGHKAVLEDTMAFLSHGTSRAVGEFYVDTVKYAPKIFGGAYKLAGLISKKRRRSPIYFANEIPARRLAEFIEDGGFDTIISTHLYPSETLTYLKRKGIALPFTVSVATDYTCIPFFEETYSDRYIIAHESLKRQYISRGVIASKLLPYGIPVRQEYFAHRDKREARRELNLPEDGTLHLLVGGSMGFGDLSRFAQSFLQRASGDKLVIVSGSNRKAFYELCERFGGEKAFFAVGFTDRLDRYMDACDVIYTKPGGLTSTEALAKNLPIVHTQLIPGCETHNARFFRANGLSVFAKTPEEQLVLGNALTRSATLRSKMLEAQKSFGLKNSARLLVKLCEENAGEDV